MDNPLAIALRDSKNPDELHSHFFHYFQAVFGRQRGENVRGTNILSHDFPDSLFQNRNMTGVAVAGALLAVLDYEVRLGSEAPFVSITPEHFKVLDEIILEQLAIAGGMLLTSDLVLSRVLEWERADDKKYGRFLKALNKAARVHQRKTAAPITDPFFREAKRNAVQQLRPMWTRLREKFARQHRLPSPKQIKAAFEEEANSPAAPPFVSHPHNHQLWTRWLDFHHRDLVKIVSTFSAAKIFDSYAAFVTGHSNSDYMRKKISSVK